MRIPLCRLRENVATHVPDCTVSPHSRFKVMFICDILLCYGSTIYRTGIGQTEIYLDNSLCPKSDKFRPKIGRSVVHNSTEKDDVQVAVWLLTVK